MSYYPDPNNYSRDKIKVELDFSNHTTKFNLASLRFEVDKLDVDKLTTAPIDWSRLSNIVDNTIVKKNCIL